MTEKEMNNIQRQIREVLDSVENAFRQGGGANQVLPMLYDEDVVVVREGDVSAVRGMPAFMQAAAAFLDELGPKPVFFFTLDTPILTCGDLAITLFNVEIRPDLADAEPTHLRIFAGWKKTERGWLIAREMVTGGSL